MIGRLKEIDDIIFQLTRVSNSEDIKDRNESIEQLTPIEKVHKAGSVTNTSNTISVSKIPPTGSITIIDDLITEITNEGLYRLNKKLPPRIFIMRLNKTLFDHICLKITKATEQGIFGKDNIWKKPYQSFSDWFAENGINHEEIIPFNQNDIGLEYYAKRGCSEKQLKYIKLCILTSEYLEQNPKTTDGEEMSIRKAVKIVYNENKEEFPDWEESGLNKLYHEGQKLIITF